MIENIGHAISNWGVQRGLDRAKQIGLRAQEARDRAQGLLPIEEALQSWKEAAWINEASEAGLKAQVKVLKEALAAIAPDHELLQPSSQKFADGRPKRNIWLVFAAAFDLAATAKGLNPLKYRND